jgi:hypothetical protein
MTTPHKHVLLSEPPDPRTPFKHERLNSEAGEIRLAVLLKGKQSDSIVCWIIHTTLQSGQPYEALSYVWGSSEDEREILLMDQDCVGHHFFPVTRNLEEALRLLRSETRNRAFWIDAICINQEDDVERSAQVSMMREIYSNAFHTMVYFGPEDEISAKGMELMERMATTIYMDQLPESGLSRDSKKINGHPVRTILEELDGLETVLQIYSRPVSRSTFHFTLFYSQELIIFYIRANFVQWWSRVWIAQELAVAKEAVLQWGKKQLPWECCGRTVAALHNYMGHLRDTPEFEESETWEKIDDYAFWTMAITETCNGFSQFERPLLDLLQRFWLNEATDPRDKVYALLGLATDNHPNSLVPDYSLPVGTVYGMVVKDLMTRSKNLDFLSLCSSTGPRRVEGLATWAPNWRTEGKKAKMVPGYHTFSLSFINERPWVYSGTDPPLEKRRRFCASGESNSLETVRFSEDFRELLVTGIVVDIVSQLSEVRSYQFSQEEISQVWGAMGDTLARYPTGEPAVSAFVSTVCANQSDLNIDTLLADPHVFSRCQSVVTSGRRFLITENGLMGMAVAETEVGDIVCVIKGSRVPIILRVEGDHFVMVGEAYGKLWLGFQSKPYSSLLLTVY